MDLKLLLILGLVILYFFMSGKPEGKKNYFYLTILMLVVRELDVPYLGNITPTSITATILFLGSVGSLKPYLSKWTLYILMLIFSLLLAIVNVDPYSKAAMWGFNLFVVCELAVVTPIYIKTLEDMQKMIKYLLITCFIFSFTTLLGYWGYADGVVIFKGLDESMVTGDIYHASRIYGISNSNLVQIISVISIILIPKLQIKRKWLEWLIIGVFTMGALVTLKRMSFIALVAAMLYYVQSERQMKHTSTLLVVVLIFVVLVMQFWEPISYRFGIAGFGGGEIEDHSTESRFYRMGFAIDAYNASPIVGMGAGYVIYVHNGFMEILGNCGILGILLIFFKYIPNWKILKQLEPWACATFVYLVTCFSLESAINSTQMLGFLGLFYGGYIANKQLSNY